MDTLKMKVNYRKSTLLKTTTDIPADITIDVTMRNSLNGVLESVDIGIEGYVYTLYGFDATDYIHENRIPYWVIDAVYSHRNTRMVEAAFTETNLNR
jgi:hypothetical protein